MRPRAYEGLLCKKKQSDWEQTHTCGHGLTRWEKCKFEAFCLPYLAMPSSVNAMCPRGVVHLDEVR